MTRRGLRLTPAARDDLAEALVHARELNQAAADRLFQRLQARLTLLARLPLASRPRDEIAEGLRSVWVAPYVIFFRVLSDTVLVLRIIHGARDIRAISVGQ